MLHAIGSRKARLAHFRAAGLRVPLEDIVTSAVFGPLLFLSPADRDQCLRGLFGRLGLDMSACTGLLTLSLWPRCATDRRFRTRSIEPDVLVRDPTGVVAVIEVKWGAPLDEDELAGQWAALSARERDGAHHLLVVRSRAGYSASISEDGAHLLSCGYGRWNPAVRLWCEIAQAMEDLAEDLAVPGHLKTWALVVADFLRREDGLSMQGWSGLGLTRVDRYRARFRPRFFAQLRPVRRVEGTELWKI